MKSDYSGNISFSIYGASHSKEIGITAEGIPSGFYVDTKRLNRFLARRSASANPLSTGRKEADIPQILSGIKNDKTDGSPLHIEFSNNDIIKKDYEGLKFKPRPSHADYTAYIKYGKDFDMSGGGHFSGRMTAPLCALGGICIQILESFGIKIISRISEIGGIRDKGELTSDISHKPVPTVDDKIAKAITEAVAKAKAEGDSLGGVIECKIIGVKKGLGGALFDGLEGKIASLVFGIPAVKGIDFGSGFNGAALKGSENNDEFMTDGLNIVTKTNNCGGILGGISNGMPIVFRAAFKPTPSISKPQNTVDLNTMQNTVIEIKGRHDPCIVLRALPCVESAAAIALLDLILEEKAENLSDCRRQIDSVDSKIIKLFTKRMAISEKIAEIKHKNGLDIYDASREEQKLNNISEKLPPELKKYGEELFRELFTLSKKRQSEMLGKAKIFGLVGKKLSHSFSPEIHKAIADYNYTLFETDNLEEFIKDKNFDGINVTVPYKKEIVRLLDCLSETAKETGSVNTVIKQEDETLKGYNTDVYGFLYTLEKYNIEVKDKKILVLGSGGASAGIVYALKSKGADDITVISRSGKDNYQNIKNHKTADIIVNTTPVGMYPENGKSPLDLSIFNKLEAVIDIIYNPSKTKLLLDAEERGIKAINGLTMLVAQANKSAELFCGIKANDITQDKIKENIELETKNIILIGMPSCGKTTAAKIISEITKRDFYDTDLLIKQKCGKYPSEIIESDGEDAFRKIETEILTEVTKKSGAVIGCGGGVVERKENKALLKQNSTVVYLYRPLRFLSTKNRPISKEKGLYELYERRNGLYLDFADIKVDAVREKEKTARKILEAIK